ncbi:replicative DNA helicase [Streptomyces prasinus]|uniref:replicative DNA helicase n=1 Tax=Streptomyces prasinus TaxID=67345 RepID=UPI0037CD5F89
MPGKDEVPDGPHRQLLTLLHRAYAAAGRPGLRRIALSLNQDDSAPATLNYQAIGKILNGKTLPNPRQLISLASWLFREGGVSGRFDGDVDALLQELLDLREMAHQEDLGIYDSFENVTGRGDVESQKSPTVAGSAEITNERKLLSCMLRSKDALAEVVEVVTSIAFKDGLHREVYEALLQLYADGVEITIDSAAEVLSARTEASPTGMRKYLDTLTQGNVDVKNAGLYAERTVDFAKLRRVEALGGRFTELAKASSSSEGEPGVDSLLSLVEEEIYSFVNDINAVSPASAVLERALDEVEAAGSREVTIGLPSGFRDLDSLNSGFRPGELIVVAGASSMGKSTFGLDLVRNCSIAHSWTSFLASLQMSREEMLIRMMAAEGRVALHHMRSGTMTDEDWTRLAIIMPSVHKAPVYMHDEAEYKIAELVRHCRRLSAFKDLRLVVIDSLDLLYADSPGIAGESEHRFATMGRELRRMAKDLNIPVVALFQIERSLARESYNWPELHDIPGGLERFADLVILLHRPDAYDKMSPRAGEADLIIAKNRSGPTATVTVAFQGHYARFVDMNN